MLQKLEVSRNLSGIAERCEREGEAVAYLKDITFEAKNSATLPLPRFDP